MLGAIGVDKPKSGLTEAQASQSYDNDTALISSPPRPAAKDDTAVVRWHPEEMFASSTRQLDGSIAVASVLISTVGLVFSAVAIVLGVLHIGAHESTTTTHTLNANVNGGTPLLPTNRRRSISAAAHPHSHSSPHSAPRRTGSTDSESSGLNAVKHQPTRPGLMSPVLSSETTVSTSSLASDETLVSFADSTWHHPNHPRSATAESESSTNTDATQRGRSSAKGKGVCGSRLASALCGSHAGANANGSANGSSASLAASSSRSSSKARTMGSSNGPVSGTAAGVVSSSYSVPQPSPKPKRRYGHAWRASFDGHSTALAALTPTEDDQLYHGSDSELPSPSGSSNGGLRRFRDVLRSRSQSRPRTMSSKTIPRPPPSTSPLTLVTPGLEPATPTLQILTSSPTESLTNTPGIGSVALVSAPSSSSAGTSSASSTAPSGHSHSRSSTFATSPSVQTDGSMSPPPFPLSAFKSPISPSMPLSTPTPHAKTPLFHRPGILKRASSSSRSRARPGSAASSRVPSESSPAPPVPSLSASPSASTSNHSCPLSGSASSKPKKEKKVKPPPLRTTYTYTFAAVPSDDEDAGPAAHEHETSEQHAAGRHSVDEHVRIALGHDAHGQTPAADTTEHSHSHPHGHSPPQRKHTHTAVPIFVQLAPRPAGSLPEHIMPKVATPTTVVDEFGNLINIPAGSDATVGAGKCPLADKQERARVDSTSKPPVSGSGLTAAGMATGSKKKDKTRRFSWKG